MIGRAPHYLSNVIGPVPHTSFGSERRSDCANQVDASFRTAIRSPANGISGVCASRFLAAPPSQGADAVAPPSAARVACEAIGDYRVRGSLHAALQDASTWLAQQIRIVVLSPRLSTRSVTR